MERWLFVLATGEDPGKDFAESERARAFLPSLALCAYRARLGGMVFGPLEYKELSAVERVALADAGERLRAEEAVTKSGASKGPIEAGAILAPYDEGVAHDRAVLSEFHESLVAATAKKASA